jgi:hypothetical protein
MVYVKVNKAADIPKLRLWQGNQYEREDRLNGYGRIIFLPSVYQDAFKIIAKQTAKPDYGTCVTKSL